MIEDRFEVALTLAVEHRGGTSPNPPVGCVLLDQAGQVLAVGAHERAGEGHAEANALAACRRAGAQDRIHTVVVTLEPCNHRGLTPPCTEAVLASSARVVWIGAIDPNGNVAGGGAGRLAGAGLKVRVLDPSSTLGLRCRDLIAPFAKHRLTGRSWVTVKQALDRQGGMIPPPGRTTFTSPPALSYAHRLRRRADAILTGSGTVLADDPAFTVRHVSDHPGKRRMLAVLDRRGRVPHRFIADADARGLEAFRATDLEAALDELGRRGALEVLVEAGPCLTAALLSSKFWDEHVLIHQGPPGGSEIVEVRRRDPARLERFTIAKRACSPA